MGYSLQTLSGFEAFLAAQGFDNKSTGEIISYLEGLGLTTQVATDIETGGRPPIPAFSPFAQVDIATNSNVLFNPQGANAVLLDIGDANITVTGSSNVAVSAANGDNVINLDGSTGYDDVFLSTGNNTVDTGLGSDTVFGGVGNETYLEKAGSANDTFYAGTGTNSYTDNSSSSNAFLGAGLSGNDSVVIDNTGDGTDTITLGQGHNTVAAGSAADNLYINQSGKGSASVTFGSGQDTVDFATGNGKGIAGVVDSVSAGSGPETVDFVGAPISSAHLYYTPTGVDVTFGGTLIPNGSGGYMPNPANPPVQVVSITAAPGSDVTLEFTNAHLKA